MGRIKAIAAGVLLTALLFFVAQNTQVVDVHFLVWKIEMSWAIMLLAILAIGFVLGWIVSSIAMLRE